MGDDINNLAQMAEPAELAHRAVELLEEAVLGALYEFALERRGFVRTGEIAGRLGLLLQTPNGRSYAGTVVLAICRRLQQAQRVVQGRPSGATRPTEGTGWQLRAGELQARMGSGGRTYR